VLPVYLETMISPGSDFAEELKIKLVNGDQIVQSHYVHPHDSCGVFIEHADGNVTRIYDPKDHPSTTSYALQHELCNKLLEDVSTVGNKATHTSSAHTIDESVFLIEFIEKIAENVTEGHAQVQRKPHRE